jgi:hypothetical protein
VIAHEVGHALGFPHNMGASCAYDTESYRNAAFTQKNGIAASLMDYARFNYIAQPGDEGIRFIRQMGPYDHYAVNWGYRVIPNSDSPEAEVPTLEKWILEKAGDPMYKYGKQSSSFDPTSQTEDIGNNSMKASSYGLKNLEYVATHLSEWTSDVTNNYDDLSELYDELLSVWSRYIGHVVTNVGGVYEDLKKPNQKGVVYTVVAKTQQQEAMKWLQANAFNSPTWLVNLKTLKNTDYSGYTERFRKLQARHLDNMLSFDRLGRLMDAEILETNNYTALELLRDMRKGIWKEANTATTVSIYRRNLQRAYLERMEYLMKEEMKSDRSADYYNVAQSDIRALVRGELTTLKTELGVAKSRAINTETKYHYADCMERIELILDPK